MGLSPRVRGNRPLERPLAGSRRSIPARTGEPTAAINSMIAKRVYPRAYGGTRQTGRRANHCRGLSPRVRGNHEHRLIPRGILGSIPARTGEPPTEGLSYLTLKVYPRAYGGTKLPHPLDDHYGGLSPRVRGNPHPNQEE